MRHWFSGVYLLWLLFMAAAGCVPVEEKTATPFITDINDPSIRQVYNLQTAQRPDSLKALLSDEDPALQWAAARAFASFTDTTALEGLIALLSHENGEVRRMAAVAIGHLGKSDAEAALTQAFDGRDSARLYIGANSAILEAMGWAGSPGALNALSTISTYQPSDTLLLLGQVRGIYRYALRNMVDKEGTATMVNYLTNAGIPFEVRLIAAHYLQRTSNIDLTPFSTQLKSLWQSETNPQLRMCIATAIGKLKTKEARELLTSSLAAEADYRVKCNIIRAMQNFDYADISDLLLEYAKSTHPAIAEVASDYFISHGRERDASRYAATMNDCKTWQSKTRMAEAANKNMISLFSPAKTKLQKDILAELNEAKDAYEKAAWVKAYASELRNFESVPKYIESNQPLVVRTQAVQSLIDATRDKNFDTYFAGEGHLIRNQIGSYLANAMQSGDAGILALVAGAITDSKTGLKAVMSDRKSDLSKALGNLKLPEETETYLELAKALKEYDIETPALTPDQASVKPIDWTIIDKLKDESRIHIITSMGDIHLELYPDRAPQSVANFIQLVNDGFYNGKAFHRVVPNFVVQTGCPRGDGYGSLDFTIRSEVADAYYNDEGYVGMASAGPHTEGTQFFITHSATPHLDGRYTIFGKVTSGMQVVHQLGIGATIKQINILY